MDFNLEIISEEGRSHDPLFSSIISAMNSMKEATADKIYQKIQKEGAKNYSKPQVDRALASALKYGIFEVKNNRYRVRDDILDDVDTVYWKMQKKREQTPFRIQDNMNERQLEQKLDPEKDNLRFKKLPPDPEASECPQCGRTKRPSSETKEESNTKREKKEKTKNGKESENSKGKKKRALKKKQKHKDDESESEECKAKEPKRKLSGEKRLKHKRFAAENVTNAKYFRDEALVNPKDFMPGGGKYDTTDESELDSLSFLSDDEQSFSSYQVKPRNKSLRNDKLSRLDSDIIKGDNEKTIPTRSSVSIKSESDSEMSSLTGEPSKSNVTDNFYGRLPFESKNDRIKEKNQYFTSGKLFERDEADECERKSDWIGYSDDPKGAIIQSNNVLTIEPMDSMAFKGPEHTSYIS